MDASIRAVRPKDVAAEVEAAVRQGFTSFVLESIDDGGMLDRERMGAARYSAGVRAAVQLKCSARMPAVASGLSK